MRLGTTIQLSRHDFLQKWASIAPKPIVLFIDEIDSLIGDTLISVLRQLRTGYLNRPHGFPQSVCLIGVRDVKDYRIFSEEKQAMVLGGSAFNIKAESLVLSNFSEKEVQKLYQQHTEATGQIFTEEAVAYAFEQTRGQPWLVNALAYQACFRDLRARDQPVTKDVLMRAREELILRRDTHLDVLLDRLQEERVVNIIDAILAGKRKPDPFPTNDVKYASDLGLITKREGMIAIANPIYQEVIPRELTFSRQDTLTQKTASYQDADGTLNMQKVLSDFTQFYRENVSISHEELLYKESGPHLLIMAYLQRVVNGGGRIHREYALGRGRVDLFVEFGKQSIVIELKIYRSPKTLEEGLHQTAEYMRTKGADEGHLIIFDRSDKPWDEKIYQKSETVGKESISVWGL